METAGLCVSRGKTQVALIFLSSVIHPAKGRSFCWRSSQTLTSRELCGFRGDPSHKKSEPDRYAPSIGSSPKAPQIHEKPDRSSSATRRGLAAPNGKTNPFGNVPQDL